VAWSVEYVSIVRRELGILEKFIADVGPVIAVIVLVGNCSIPLAVLIGWIK
jgi:hypothetical protein